MKRKLFFGVFILLTFFCYQLSAQVIPPESIRHGGKFSRSNNKGKKAKKAKSDKMGGASDVVTLNLTSLSVSNLSLRFEHRLKGKLSVGLGAGYLLPGILPNVLPYESLVTINDVGIQPSGGEFSGFNATPEIRLYPFSKRGAPYGFYLSLFGRYFNYDWKVPYISAETGSGDKTTSNGTFNVSGLGGGLSMGAQFLIKDRVVIDFFFLGGGLASSSLSGDVSNPNITGDMNFYDDIGVDLKDFYGDIPSFNSDKLTVSSENERVSFELSNQLFPILRVGLGLGIAF